MKWVRISDYAMRCDPWTICAITHGEGYSFELWHDKQPVCVGPSLRRHWPRPRH